ncbi:transglycosylase SLT domain-containing protein [Oceanicoccus sp. KOV_DT_Chl]|uniref:transglycosylase SLT domain-containing protein n=1 Tax=Oceanicoccus sp. KOV_DT_Chl TaxID=1904639 RepID=UPI000C7D5CF5|nr:transglycosylase SLT domain-containing protein [Oceanicoccus sp. KOV_DT_Chl]
MNKKQYLLLLLLPLLFLVGCTVSPPKNQSNICEIFREKDDWYDEAEDARSNWYLPIPTMMAIMYQESRFQQKAKPPRTKILGFIPGPRPSDSYGYSQAKDDTWDWYIKSSGNYGADRDDFADAIDFIGWYNSVSRKKCNIKPDDTYHLYLAYHEGHGGFNRRTYNKKPWLKGVAKKVSARAARYQSQLNSCEKELQGPWWKFW